MHANLTHFHIEATASGFIRVGLKTDKMDRTITTVMTIDEAVFAFDSINAQNTFHPFFDDGIYLIKYAPHGARLLHKDGGTNRKAYGTGETIYGHDPKPRLPWLYKLLDRLARKLETEHRPYHARWTGDYETGEFVHEYYITFPLIELSHLVKLAISQAKRLKHDRDEMERATKDESVPYWLRPKFDYDIAERTWSHTVRPETISYLTGKYLPNIRYEYHIDALAGYKAAIHDPRVQREKRHADLRQQMYYLGNIARNSSDGNLVTIEVYPEHNGDAPLSFGWSIWAWTGRTKTYHHNGYYKQPDGRKVMNGGIIAHASRYQDDEQPPDWTGDWPPESYYDKPVKSYEYSTHT